MNEEKYQRRLSRERRAREEAERLLNEKSLALYKSAQTLELALWASQEYVWHWDLKKKLCQVTHFDGRRKKIQRDWTTDTLRSVVHPDDLDELFNQVNAHDNGWIDNIDIACRFNLNNEWTYMRLRGQSASRIGDTERLMIGTARDITEHQKQLRQLDYLARTDPLTGTLNRRTMQEELVDLANSGRQFCVLFVDVDNFKLLNDSQGHTAGDQFLRALSDGLVARLPASALVSRFGGDEFLCAFEHRNDWVDRVSSVAGIERLLPTAAVEKAKDVSLSIGVALFPEHTDNSERLVEYADYAMYEAKRQGKNRWCVYEKALFQAKKRTVTMLSELRKSIENEDVSFVIQPKFCLGGVVAGAELLCRWHSPVFGQVSPAVFIPLAIEHGLLGQLSRLAVRAAVLLQSKIDHREVTSLAVNVAADDILSREFIDDLAGLCDQAGVSRDLIELEVTESIFLNDLSSTEAAIDRIKCRGFKIAMDDFGTGYSSLAYISRYKFDSIKIDRTFVSSMLNKEADRLVIESIVALCKALGIKTVAEGVETQSQLQALQDIGVDEFQGFLLSKPIDEATFLALLKRQGSNG